MRGGNGNIVCPYEWHVHLQAHFVGVLCSSRGLSLCRVHIVKGMKKIKAGREDTYCLFAFSFTQYAPK